MVHPFYHAIVPSFPLHHFPSSDIQVCRAMLLHDLNLSPYSGDCLFIMVN